jgi:hypothetical protein
MPSRRHLALALLVLAACDTSGIHSLGRLRDALVPCDSDPLGRTLTTSTWLRSTADGTEIVLFGRPDPTATVAFDAPACYGRAFVAHDGSVTLESGSYSLDATGLGEASRGLEFTLANQADRPILKRDGAVRRDLATPISATLEVRRDGDQLVVTLDGEARRMTALGDVVDRIDVTTQAGAEDAFRLFNLPIFTSQARLLGFGSGAMTQYAGSTAEFIAIIRNDFTVNVQSLLDPNTDITYRQFEELTGIVVDGLQRTDVNTSGNGSMSGVLSFVMRGTTEVLRGSLDYQGLGIGDGVAASGTYTLTLDGAGGGPHPISFQLATDVDLQAVLPVDAP